MVYPYTLRHRLWLLLAAAALSFVLAACAKSMTPAGPASTSAPTQALVAPASAEPTHTIAKPSATLTQQPPPASATPMPTETPSPSPQPSPSLSPEPPAATKLYQGIPVGFTDEGFPYLGDPDAPVTLEEYSDYACPFCSRHVVQTVPSLIEDYVSSGQARMVFYDMPLANLHPTAPQGHEAALCVAEQGADLFWALHDELFVNQKEWAKLPDPSEYLESAAAKVGADAAAYAACIADGRQEQQVLTGIAAGRAAGFTGTPSFRFVRHSDGASFGLVGARPLATFSAWLDAILAGNDPPQEEASSPKPPQLPLWATAKGLAPDPDRPGLTVAGDPFKGDPTAKVVVVEFADFQCPPCMRHALEVQPVLDETFVDSREIMWVFKHLPLRIHPQAPAAAAASECAADQGKFWEMHDLLFEAQAQWAVENPGPALLGLAKQLELDVDAFGACLASEETQARVQADLADAQGVVNSTPSFIILYGGQGGLLSGSRAAGEFVSILQGVLAKAEAGKPLNAQ